MDHSWTKHHLNRSGLPDTVLSADDEMQRRRLVNNPNTDRFLEEIKYCINCKSFLLKYKDYIGGFGYSTSDETFAVTVNEKGEIIVPTELCSTT